MMRTTNPTGEAAAWGVYYPHVVWLPDSVLERLLREDGEAAVITDR